MLFACLPPAIQRDSIIFPHCGYEIIPIGPVLLVKEDIGKRPTPDPGLSDDKVVGVEFLRAYSDVSRRLETIGPRSEDTMSADVLPPGKDRLIRDP